MSDSLPSGSPSDHEPATTATTSPEEATTTSSTTTTTSTPEGPSPPPIQIPLSWPSNSSVTLDWIQNLISAFDWSSKNLPPSELPSVLPVSVFDALVLTASKILHKEPNCVRIDDCNENSRVVVVGDVHGQLHDVMFLLQDAGFPFEDRFFVFNGDYVDRGAWGLETFLLLLAWKVIFFKTLLFIAIQEFC
jgi:serine/threonine-protein phosphatase 5